jgi:hypothetical protein
MSKFVQLLTPAYVNGRMRHPHEGVLHLENDEADRLIETEAGKDVTADFSAEQRKETPVEALRANSDHDRAAATLDPVPHQADVAPAPETPPASRKAPAKKED